MLRPLIKLLRLGGLIVSGLVLALFFYPGMDRAARDRKLMAWASRLMAILEIDVQVCGAVPGGALGGALPQSGAVLVANHVSWLDIHVLHSLLPARFISKAEVRHWPLLGRLALAAGTLFISREKKSDAIRVNQAMAAELQAGECLAFFFLKQRLRMGADCVHFFLPCFNRRLTLAVRWFRRPYVILTSKASRVWPPLITAR